MKKPILLLVNDDPSILQTLNDLIHSRFQDAYRVLTALSGEAGLSQVQACHRDDDVIALFLADQQMPGMSGIAFLAEAGRRYPQARKALLSDFADSETAIRSINEVGIDRYLVQPITPPEDVLYPALTDLLTAWRTISVCAMKHSPTTKTWAKSPLRPIAGNTTCKVICVFAAIIRPRSWASHCNNSGYLLAACVTSTPKQAG